MNERNSTMATTPALEIRSAVSGFEIRKDDPKSAGPGTLTGYAAVFDKWSENLGWFREIIRKGAFADSLANGADVRALVDHDTGRIIGRSSAGTLRVAEDDVGLRVEIDLPDTTDGRDLATSVQRGDISGMSFGFNVKRDRWTYQDESDDLDERELLEIELFEVSAVTFPAYPDTTLAKRSRERAPKPYNPTPVGVHRQRAKLTEYKTQI